MPGQRVRIVERLPGPKRRRMKMPDRGGGNYYCQDTVKRVVLPGQSRRSGEIPRHKGSRRQVMPGSKSRKVKMPDRGRGDYYCQDTVRRVVMPGQSGRSAEVPRQWGSRGEVMAGPKRRRMKMPDEGGVTINAMIQ